MLVTTVGCVAVGEQRLHFFIKELLLFEEKRNYASVCQLTHLRKVVALSSVLLWFLSKSD